MAIWLAGGRAVRISTHQPTPHLTPNGLVIGGGDDVHPTLYDEVAAHQDYDQARDALEIRYIHWALEQSIPLLGICRGMQLINVVQGGKLFADISRLRKKTSNKEILLPRKPVHITAQTRLAELVGKPRLRVNSLHHQAVSELGHSLQVCALDNDGFIQALEHSQQGHIAGVQWHPEYLFYLPKQLCLFRRLVKQSRARYADGPPTTKPGQPA